jgi:flagellar secretion chaperone FliS
MLAADTKHADMNASQMYRQTQAQTAAPGELVVMLYQGAVRFVTSAIESLESNAIADANTSLVRTQAIITELSQTLDVERGGDVARNLARIYQYLNGRLIEANLRKDPAPAREVQHLLRELLPAWQAAVRQTSAAVARPLVSAAV